MYTIKELYEWMCELDKERQNEHRNMIIKDESKYKMAIITGEMRMLDRIKDQILKEQQKP